MKRGTFSKVLHLPSERQTAAMEAVNISVDYNEDGENASGRLWGEHAAYFSRRAATFFCLNFFYVEQPSSRRRVTPRNVQSPKTAAVYSDGKQKGTFTYSSESIKETMVPTLATDP